MKIKTFLLLLLFGWMAVGFIGCKPTPEEPTIDGTFDEIVLQKQEQAAASLLEYIDLYGTQNGLDLCALLLADEPEVDSATVNGWNIDIVYSDGTEGAILYRPHLELIDRMEPVSRDIDNANNTSSRNAVLIWDPFNESLSSDATSFIVNEYKKNGFDVKVISGSNCNIESLKNDIYGYDIVQFQTHGELGKWIVTKQVPTQEDDIALRAERRQRKIKRVTIPTTGESFYAVSNKFIAALERNFESTVIFNWSCESLKNDDLWKAFQSKGCEAYLGYSNSDEMVHAMNTAIFMTPDLAAGMTLGAAYDKYEHKDFTYTDKKGHKIVSRVLLAGNREVTFFDAPSVPVIGGHEYVDLGLPSGTLWATCNVGANAPEEYGDYFAWGETQPKNYYWWGNYHHCNGSENTLTRYCNNYNNGYNGFTDNLSTLLPEDDAATANWGADWRMATKEEFEELYNNTSPVWATINGVNGRLFTGLNGNTLFLPAAGDRYGTQIGLLGTNGYYWSSSLKTEYTKNACHLYLSENAYGIAWCDRCCGRPVRPVCSAK